MIPYYNPYLSPNSIIWTQGLAGAQGVSVAPGQTVPIFDSEEQVIYLKSVDQTGKPSMKILDYTIRDNTKEMDKYLTKDEFEKRFNELKELVEAKNG